MLTILVGLVGAKVASAKGPACTLLGCEKASGATPFQKAFSLAGTSDACAEFTVPDGRRLVVTNLAGSTIVPAGKEIGGTIGIGNAFVPFVMSREAFSPTIQDRLNFSQPTLFYGEEGKSYSCVFRH